ncbi:hypothetical protein [Halobacillus karajensis]|nr:hypothetical protein [Halobacillus karajensis]
MLGKLARPRCGAGEKPEMTSNAYLLLTNLKVCGVEGIVASSLEE